MLPIFASLVRSPLLLGDLPEARAFNPRVLTLTPCPAALDLSQKLGHLYEDALAILLEGSSTYDLLEQRLQLHMPGKSTIGELDFLLRDLSSDQLIHLELATKFYLAVETPDGITFPGPDSRDNFSKKVHRLRSHQLPLAKNYRYLLPGAYREESITVRHLIHGCIFDHIASTTPASPEFVNPHRRQGSWLTVTELSELFPLNTGFETIPKHLWLVPPDLLANTTLEPWTPPAFLDRCVMLRITGETLPHFITPDGYPQQAKR